MQHSSHHRCQPCHVISLICACNVWCYHTYVQPYPCPRHSMGNPSQFHTSTLRHTCGCIAVLCPQRKTNWINIDRTRDHCQWDVLSYTYTYTLKYDLSSSHTIALESHWSVWSQYGQYFYAWLKYSVIILQSWVFCCYFF